LIIVSVTAPLSPGKIPLGGFLHDRKTLPPRTVNVYIMRHSITVSYLKVCVKGKIRNMAVSAVNEEMYAGSNNRSIFTRAT